MRVQSLEKIYKYGYSRINDPHEYWYFNIEKFYKYKYFEIEEPHEYEYSIVKNLDGDIYGKNDFQNIGNYK